MLVWGPLLDPGQNVGLAQDQQVLAVDLDLGAAVLAVENGVALADVERPALAVLDGAVPNREDLALLRLLLRGVGEHDAAGGRLLLLERPNDQAVSKGLELH